MFVEMIVDDVEFGEGVVFGLVLFFMIVMFVFEKVLGCFCV